MTVKPSQRLVPFPTEPKPASGASYCPDGGGHHWAILPPNGPTSEGTCKKCGETRQHPNSIDDALGYYGPVLRGMGRLVQS